MKFSKIRRNCAEMASKKEDNRIKLTTFVNPHLFYFKWLRNEGEYNIYIFRMCSFLVLKKKSNCDFLLHSERDEEFDAFETKIEQTAKSYESKPLNLKVGNVVAVYLPDWNKTIRASVKKLYNEDIGKMSVWAIDYGYPLLVDPQNVRRLPNSFSGMHKDTPRILVGGIENCLPAEMVYDIETQTSTKVRTTKWSAKAIELAQDVLSRAIKVEFEHVEMMKPRHKPHWFGRLMIQRQSDGQMFDLVKVLMDMKCAMLVSNNFKVELTTVETLEQQVYMSTKNELLTTELIVQPFKSVVHENCYLDDDEDDAVEDDDENSEIPIDELPDEDNEFFNDSVSMIQTKGQSNGYAVSDVNELPAIQEDANKVPSNSSATITNKSKNSAPNDNAQTENKGANSKDSAQPNKRTKTQERNRRNQIRQQALNQNNQNQNQQNRNTHGNNRQIAPHSQQSQAHSNFNLHRNQNQQSSHPNQRNRPNILECNFENGNCSAPFRGGRRQLDFLPLSTPGFASHNAFDRPPPLIPFVPKPDHRSFPSEHFHGLPMRSAFSSNQNSPNLLNRSNERGQQQQQHYQRSMGRDRNDRFRTQRNKPNANAGDNNKMTSNNQGQPNAIKTNEAPVKLEAANVPVKTAPKSD